METAPPTAYANEVAAKAPSIPPIDEALTSLLRRLEV